MRIAGQLTLLVLLALATSARGTARAEFAEPSPSHASTTAWDELATEQTPAWAVLQDALPGEITALEAESEDPEPAAPDSLAFVQVVLRSALRVLREAEQPSTAVVECTARPRPSSVLARAPPRRAL